MKVLWVVNLILPAFAEAEGLPFSEREGWLSGLYAAVRGAGENRDLELAVAYPVAPGGKSEKKEWDGTVWYGFTEDLTRPEIYAERLEGDFAEILADFRPDLVHLFGTEFPHTLACLRALHDPERALVGIQGICGGIAEHYMAGLPENVQHEATIRDRIRDDSLIRQQEKFRIRAAHEREALTLARHVTGRTAYDERISGEINPERIYHPVNETLRSNFYTAARDRKQIVPHRIFLPQGDYPLKGFHYLLQVLPELIGDYPDLTLVVAGNIVTGGDGRRIPLFLRIGAYGRYCNRLISKGHLREHVITTGRLSAERMCREMAASQVFVLPSEIENSPNSMGEAMLLGMPVIASDTGGIPSLITDKKEGLLVRPGDLEGLTAAIRQIFEEPVIADVYGENAKKRACVTHDPGRNLTALLKTYEQIAGGRRT